MRHPSLGLRFLLILAAAPLVGGSASCSDRPESRPPDSTQGQEQAAAKSSPETEAPPLRVPVPSGKTPLTEGELRESLIGKKYLNVTIRALDHPRYEAFSYEGRFYI